MQENLAFRLFAHTAEMLQHFVDPYLFRMTTKTTVAMRKCYGCASTPRLTCSSLFSILSNPFPSRSVPPVPSSIPAQVPSPLLRYSRTCLASPLGLVARDPALTFGPALAPLSPTRVRSAFCLMFVRISKVLCLLTRCLLSPFTPSARVFKPTLLPVLFARFGIDFDNSTLLLSPDLLPP